jgi:hypothetical protein
MNADKEGLDSLSERVPAAVFEVTADQQVRFVLYDPHRFLAPLNHP